MVQAKSSAIKDFFSRKGQIKSYLFMILSCFAWVFGFVYGNQHNFIPAETNLSRSIVMTIGTYYLCRMLNLNIEYKSPKSWRILIKRHASFIIQGFVLAGVQFFMPLGIVQTLGSCGPIFTIILQRILRKDNTFHITGRKLNGCVIALIGIILTSNGKFIYSYFDKDFQFKSQFENYVSSDFAVMVLVTILFIGSLVLSSYGVLITQEAKCHAFQIVFHFAVSNLIFSSLSYLFVTQKKPPGEMYQSLIWIGGFLSFSEVGFNLSLNLSENFALTNITCFFNVVVGYGIGILRYGQMIDAVSLIGTGLVVGGVSMVILAKSQNQNGIQSDPSLTLKKLTQNKKTNTDI